MKRFRIIYRYDSSTLIRHGMIQGEGMTLTMAGDERVKRKNPMVWAQKRPVSQREPALKAKG
jgi:hypothetical protein